MTRKCAILVTMLIALGTMGIGARSAHAAGSQVAFAGAYAGTFAFTSASTANVSGTGAALYLGISTNQGVAALTGAASSCTGGFTAVNTETLTATNGDALMLTIHEVSCPISPGVYHGTGTWVVTGGMGRFSGATGQGNFNCREDFNQDVYAYLLSGTVSAPQGS